MGAGHASNDHMTQKIRHFGRDAEIQAMDGNDQIA
jgi:hypothetical protein